MSAAAAKHATIRHPLQDRVMQIENGKVVFFHYWLKDDAGNDIESSEGRTPMAIMYGRGNIIPGLEKALAGRSEGDRFDVIVTPGEGYGERRDNFTQRVPKKYVPDADSLKPGDSTMLQTDQGPRSVVVVKVGSSVVDVDLNHPMAGKTLHFAIEITQVRDATQEEDAHGHVHGEGGHHH
jgi:FKBP-type peptidyl-prolyl cis-trans isomerase SlyD